MSRARVFKAAFRTWSLVIGARQWVFDDADEVLDAVLFFELTGCLPGDEVGILPLEEVMA